MNSAIIVAAGSGTRFGGEKPKQFLEILGKPVIVRTLERFEACPQIDKIILVLNAAEVVNFQKQIEKFNLRKLVKVIAGGKTRAESVWNGFDAIGGESAEIIAVHDGARPLVTSEEITKTIEKARETGAACLVAAVTDTIKEVRGGKIARTVDRKTLRRALTPQCFQYSILKRAFEENRLLEAATDESFLVEQIGVEISIVEGSARNIKITHPEDLILAENLLKRFKVQSK
ncbi:MAG TPA: 2-C-methyl-D-erythritol 4-phosphate cytidylyltransferase [Pyrinomonadaceae bacterium]|nr:2-C-methyl-D-erythritol 4-phosphate cytidylyltransferase [Pyrinomonadaceae bacterium]